MMQGEDAVDPHHTAPPYRDLGPARHLSGPAFADGEPPAIDNRALR